MQILEIEIMSFRYACLAKKLPEVSAPNTMPYMPQSWTISWTISWPVAQVDGLRLTSLMIEDVTLTPTRVWCLYLPFANMIVRARRFEPPVPCATAALSCASYKCISPFDLFHFCLPTSLILWHKYTTWGFSKIAGLWRSTCWICWPCHHGQTGLKFLLHHYTALTPTGFPRSSIAHLCSRLQMSVKALISNATTQLWVEGGSTVSDFDITCTNVRETTNTNTGVSTGSTRNDRGCWLKGPGAPYDIHTDYENFAPKGVTRKYYLNVTQYPLNADGIMNFDSKAFNNSYPGPWIEACWGDDIEITVENFLDFNGTSIHWHGIRQYQTNEQDGVNGVTQCPIAPGKSSLQF